MDLRESDDDVQAYVRLALPLMSRHCVPMTPKNYTVWYRYVSGVDSELRKALDTIIEKDGAFSEERNAELYRQFCAETDKDGLRKIEEDLRQILLTVLHQVTELTGQTGEYESFVSGLVGTLPEDASVADVKSIIAAIINKTKALGKFGKAVQHKLRETTETLDALKKEFEQVKAEVFHDFLTGVSNRKAFQETLANWAGDAAFFGKGLCLLFIDIDRFKTFNDEHGHLLGDQVLKFVARSIKNLVRGADFVGRFGGEEFAVLLPNTPLNGAEVVAESIRSFFAGTSLRAVKTSKKLGMLTVSLGVASYRPGEPTEQFLSRADQALYCAKKAGRNRVATELDGPLAKREGTSKRHETLYAMPVRL